MTIMLVNLHVQDEVTLAAADAASQAFRSERLLQAHLVLVPEEEADLANFSFVHLRIEGRPRSLPAMTPQDTVVWLRSMLARLLSVPLPPAPAVPPPP